MRIERCVEKAFVEMAAGDPEFAMLCACLAVDGSAYRVAGSRANNRRRFIRFLRDHYDVLQPMGVPNLNLEASRFGRHPALGLANAADAPDVADIVYAAHRCSHGHGEDVPDGFQLLPPGSLRLGMDPGAGTVNLPETIVWGLLAVVVLAPSNADLLLNRDWFLSWTPGVDPIPEEPALTMPVDEWWGRKASFLEIVDEFPRSHVTVLVGEDEWPVVVEQGASPVTIRTDDPADV